MTRNCLRTVIRPERVHCEAVKMRESARVQGGRDEETERGRNGGTEGRRERGREGGREVSPVQAAQCVSRVSLVIIPAHAAVSALSLSLSVCVCVGGGGGGEGKCTRMKTRPRTKAGLPDGG